MAATKKTTANARRQAQIEKNRTQACNAYIGFHAEACELIDRLRAAIGDLPEPEDLEVDITWADADELAYVVSQLERVAVLVRDQARRKHHTEGINQ